MSAAAPKPSFYRMALTEYRRTAYLGKPPCVNTLKAMIDRKEWLGERTQSGRYYLFVDEAGQPIPGTPPAPKTGNPEADELIVAWSKTR